MQRRYLTPTPIFAALLKSGMGHKKVTLLRSWLNAMDNDILGSQVRYNVPSIEKRNDTNIILLVYMALAIPLKDHLGMKMIQNSLDRANPIMLLANRNFILPVISYKIQKLRVNVVEAFIGSGGGVTECDEGASRERVFCTSFIER
jgi:hypothetical protein